MSAETFRVGLHRLHFRENVPAGMNPFVIMGLVPLLKGSTEDHDPVLVRPAACCAFGCWEIADGRHRVVASLIAGRPDVLAELDPAHEEAPDP